MKKYKANNYLILRCLFSWHYFWYQIMWVFHTNSVTTGQSRITFNSDNMWSLHSLHSVRIQFQKTATLQKPTVSPQGQPYFDLTIYKFSGSHKTLFRFDNLLEWLTAFRKHFCLPFYYEGLNSATNWRVHRARHRGSTLVCPPIQKLSEPQSVQSVHTSILPPYSSPGGQWIKTSCFVLSIL